MAVFVTLGVDCHKLRQNCPYRKVLEFNSFQNGNSPYQNLFPRALSLDIILVSGPLWFKSFLENRIFSRS